MAMISDYTRWQYLRELIKDAIDETLLDEEIDEADVDDVILLISPTLEEVYAYVNIDVSAIDKRAFTDWHVEIADSIDGAVAVADYYFDLR